MIYLNNLYIFITNLRYFYYTFSQAQRIRALSSRIQRTKRCKSQRSWEWENTSTLQNPLKGRSYTTVCDNESTACPRQCICRCETIVHQACWDAWICHVMKRASAHCSASCHLDWWRRNNRTNPYGHYRESWEIRSNSSWTRSRCRSSRYIGRYRAHVPAWSDRSRWQRCRRHYLVNRVSADLDKDVHSSRAVPAASDESLLELHTVFPKVLQFKKEIMLLHIVIYIICSIKEIYYIIRPYTGKTSKTLY